MIEIITEAGAAHQAIRQVFIFTALALDAYASTVQSLVRYFTGRDSMLWAKKVVWIGAKWSLGTGIAMAILAWFRLALVMDALVPASAASVFLPAEALSSLSQPINAVAFLTDGAHWDRGDYRFLRNAMILSVILAMLGIWLVDLSSPHALMGIWLAILVLTLSRAIFGWSRFLRWKSV